MTGYSHTCVASSQSAIDILRNCLNSVLIKQEWWRFWSKAGAGVLMENKHFLLLWHANSINKLRFWIWWICWILSENPGGRYENKHKVERQRNAHVRNDKVILYIFIRTFPHIVPKYCVLLCQQIWNIARRNKKNNVLRTSPVICLNGVFVFLKKIKSNNLFR